ncbi:hypothetical protein AtEden1_Chr1g0067191 [Arabidopsis thaliana]
MVNSVHSLFYVAEKFCTLDLLSLESWNRRLMYTWINYQFFVTVKLLVTQNNIAFPSFTQFVCVYCLLT